MSKEFSVKIEDNAKIESRIESTVIDISLEKGGPRGYSAYEIYSQAGNEDCSGFDKQFEKRNIYT